MIMFKIAAIRYSNLHPQNPAMIPLANLENNIPMVIPEDTIPTMRPRSSGLLKSPERGRIICPEIVTIPILNKDNANMIKDGDNAHAANAIIDNTITMLINLFLHTKSPKGTMNNIPIAYPIWVALTNNPPLATESPNPLVICTSNG